MEIASTILAQLGTNVNKVRAMVSGQCLAIENGLQINFKGSRQVDRVQITLNSNDLYDVRFFKFNRKTYDCPIVVEYTDCYCDMLQSIWKDVTGLYLSL